jgi:exosortase K
MTLRVAVLVVAAAIALGLKQHYAVARAEELSWILGPTSALTGAVTGATFVLQPGEGYFSREHLFVIAKECAGVNFMVAAFAMLAVMLLPRVESAASAARALVTSLVASYVAAVLVNTTRIAAALWLAAHPDAVSGFSPAAVHRVEGVTVYFGGLVLLYELARRLGRHVAPERPARANRAARIGRAFRRVGLGLGSYYAVTLVLPLAGGARSAAFMEHALVVFVVPLVLVLGACAVSAALPVRSARRACARARVIGWRPSCRIHLGGTV